MDPRLVKQKGAGQLSVPHAIETPSKPSLLRADTRILGGRVVSSMGPTTELQAHNHDRLSPLKEDLGSSIDVGQIIIDKDFDQQPSHSDTLNLIPSNFRPHSDVGGQISPFTPVDGPSSPSLSDSAATTTTTHSQWKSSSHRTTHNTASGDSVIRESGFNVEEDGQVSLTLPPMYHHKKRASLAVLSGRQYEKQPLSPSGHQTFKPMLRKYSTSRSLLSNACRRQRDSRNSFDCTYSLASLTPKQFQSGQNGPERLKLQKMGSTLSQQSTELSVTPDLAGSQLTFALSSDGYVSVNLIHALVYNSILQLSLLGGGGRRTNVVVKEILTCTVILTQG